METMAFLIMALALFLVFLLTACATALIFFTVLKEYQDWRQRKIVRERMKRLHSD